MKPRTDRTALSCLAIVAIAATLNLGAVIPEPAEPTAPPQIERGWWDIPCYFWPTGPMCPKPIKEVVPNDPPEPTPPCDPTTQSCPS